MKQLTALLRIALPVTFFLFLLSSCKKNSDCKEVVTYTYYTPVMKTKPEVRANIKSNPAKPVKQPGKIYIHGNYIFLNEFNKGIHVIDNSNPSAPSNVAFIDIPGNIDIAASGNTIYADMFTDLVTIDITQPTNIVVKKITEGVFPFRYYSNGTVTWSNNSNEVIADWIARDTTMVVDCNDGMLTPLFESNTMVAFSTSGTQNSGSVGASAPSVGVGGSMARFTLMNNRLYTVSNTSLSVFNITERTNPVKTNDINIGWGIETIYPFKNDLFIGSTNGMFIYGVVNPDAPAQTGQLTHVSSCDPVIADDNNAYVTLRSGTECNGFTNQLEVLRLSLIGGNPTLAKTYAMVNPHGLSKSGNLLFICDGNAGLKIFDASNAEVTLPLIRTFAIARTFDVIAYNNIALVTAADGLYQYDYSNRNDIRLLSKISISQ